MVFVPTWSSGVFARLVEILGLQNANVRRATVVLEPDSVVVVHVERALTEEEMDALCDALSAHRGEFRVEANCPECGGRGILPLPGKGEPT